MMFKIGFAVSVIMNIFLVLLLLFPLVGFSEITEKNSYLYRLDGGWVILREGLYFDQKTQPVKFYVRARNQRTGEELKLNGTVPNLVRLFIERSANKKIRAKSRSR